MIKKLNELVLFRYIVSGGTSATATLISLFLFEKSMGIEHYLLASVFSYCVGFCFSFTLQKFWTFKNHSTKKIHHELVLYLIPFSVGLAINTFLMHLFVEGFGFHAFWSQIPAGLLTACVTFFISRWVFSNKDNKDTNIRIYANDTNKYEQ